MRLFLVDEVLGFDCHVYDVRVGAELEFAFCYLLLLVAHAFGWVCVGSELWKVQGVRNKGSEEVEV